jgi:dihydrofolate reductase
MADGSGELERPRTSVYLGLSVDGFIARPGGAVDFLDSAEATDADLGDLGFAEFMATVDSLVMGRNTFDMVIDSGLEWAYGDTPVFVLTSRDLKIPEPLADSVTAISGSPREVLSALSGRGCQSVYVDGGLTVQEFLRAGLVDEVTFTRVPVMIGSGISPVGELDADVVLTHVETTTYPNGMVKTHYRVGRD